MLQTVGDIRGLAGLDCHSIDSKLAWLTKLASALHDSIRVSLMMRYEIQISVGRLNYLSLVVDGEEVAIFTPGVGRRDKARITFFSVEAIDSWLPKIVEISEELAGKIDGRFFRASTHFASLQLQLHRLNVEGTPVVSLNKATDNILAWDADLSIAYGERIYFHEVDPESIKTVDGLRFIDIAEVESITGTSYKMAIDEYS